MRSFAGEKTYEAYPPEARKVIALHSALLERLPVVLAASLLRELRGYDWQFPYERRELDAQLAFLAQPPSERTKGMLQQFTALPLPAGPQQNALTVDPGLFLEEFTAGLWARHAIEQFRACSEAYGDILREVRQGLPDADEDRLAIVLIGRGAQTAKYPLFSKLRQQGTYFSSVDTTTAMQDAVAALQQRSSRKSGDFKHWYVDGANTEAVSNKDKVCCLSFDGVGPVRSSLRTRLQEQITRGLAGPEAVRTALMAMQPEKLTGFPAGESEVMKHFTLRVLSDGSGTQVFSTTFVQWTSREILRRANPATLLARYAPRMSQLPQDLFEGDQATAVDAGGALMDADMGAYYTWLSLGRTAGRGTKTLVAVFEGGHEAVAIAPGLPASTTSSHRVTLAQILGWAGA